MPSVEPFCPECTAAVVSEHGKIPWCERCEWNLAEPDLDPLLSRTERFRAKISHAIAYDLTRGLFTKLVGRSAQRPSLGGGFAALLLISAIVVVLFSAAVAVAFMLILRGNPVMKIAGGLLLAFAVMFRPRIGSARKVLKEVDVLAEDQAPELFRLVRRIAEVVGAPMPHKIAIDARFNASAGTMGPTRRRIMVLGLPLLAVLRPQERVALIGHEVGHFINHDSRRHY